MIIGSVGCFISIGIFTDDENDLINSSLRLVCFICWTGVGGDKHLFPRLFDDSIGEIKSDNENVFGF